MEIRGNSDTHTIKYNLVNVSCHTDYFYLLIYFIRVSTYIRYNTVQLKKKFVTTNFYTFVLRYVINVVEDASSSPLPLVKFCLKKQKKKQKEQFPRSRINELTIMLLKFLAGLLGVWCGKSVKYKALDDGRSELTKTLDETEAGQRKNRKADSFYGDRAIM